jgi:glutamate/tyrosine decarboxylase-like PLP-dependent enzyme
MDHIQSFESFLNEAVGPPVSPEVAIRMSAQASMNKIADLKKELREKPEQRDFILAKIQVEVEKLDVVVAKRNLMTAKEREEVRKEREKARAEMEKEKEKIRKEQEKKISK